MTPSFHLSTHSIRFYGSLLLLMIVGQATAEDIFTNQFESLVALRTSELQIVDPHIFTLVAGIVCLDITGQVNDQIQTSIDTDGDNDGFLDVNNIVRFATDQVDYLTTQPVIAQALQAQCVDPLHSEPCTVTSIAPQQTITLPAQSGQCLAPEAGSISNYTPPPNVTSAPCYATEAIDSSINLAGVDVNVMAFQSANRYMMGELNTDQGLNKGFISESDAENIVFPAQTPVIGGRTLASLLPGGDGSCSDADDRDVFTDGQTMGWWFYFNTRSELVELQ